MFKHWIDSKGREVGRCTYCLQVGKASNLRKMPERYWDDETDLGREYCPRCYDTVYENVRKQPWNRDKF